MGVLDFDEETRWILKLMHCLDEDYYSVFPCEPAPIKWALHVDSDCPRGSWTYVLYENQRAIAQIWDI